MRMREPQLYKLWQMLRDKDLIDVINKATRSEIESIMIDLDYAYNDGAALKDDLQRFNSEVEHYESTDRWLQNNR